MTNNPETTPSFEVLPLTAERWPDLEDLFGAHGAYGGCWCMWWRLPRSEFQRMSGEEKRQGLKDLAETGPVPGLIGYLDGQSAAWIAIAPRETFGALERSRTLKRIDDQPVWSIVCFFVRRSARGQGLTLPLIRAALAYAARQGAAIVEAYPIDTPQEDIPPVNLFMGRIETFRQAGFVEVARFSAKRPVMRWYG